MLDNMITHLNIAMWHNSLNIAKINAILSEYEYLTIVVNDIW